MMSKKQRREIRQSGRAKCPECGTKEAIGNPPAPGDDPCPQCGYDPGKSLTEHGWEIALKLWGKRRKSKVRVLRPEDKEAPIIYVKFNWEHARSFVVEELGESLEMDGKELPSVESIISSWSDLDKRI